MAATEIYKCARCGDPFRARTADRKRGWARFCSKSCKAIRQTQRTGIGREGRPVRDDAGCRPMHPAELNDHGQW